MVARLAPDQKVECSSHVGIKINVLNKYLNLKVQFNKCFIPNHHSMEI